VVLAIVESAVPFHWQETVAMPFMLWLEFCIGAEEVKRDRRIKRSYLHSILGSLYMHPPIPRVCVGMRVTIADKSFHSETKRTVSPDQRVLDVSSVLALSHPNPLFKHGIGNRKSRDRRCAFQAEALNVEVTFRLNGAAGPAICVKRVVPAVVARRLFQFRD